MPGWRFGLEHQQRHGAPSNRRSWAVQRLNTTPGQLVRRAHHTDLNEHGARGAIWRPGAIALSLKTSDDLAAGRHHQRTTRLFSLGQTLLGIFFSGPCAAVRRTRTRARSTNPAESRTGRPLTPHSSSARLTSASALRAPSPVLLQSPVTSAPSARLLLPGPACAMSGIGSIPGAAGGNPVVFFDISIGGHSAGRIKMEVCAATHASDHARHRSHPPRPTHLHASTAAQCTVTTARARLCVRSSLRTSFHARRITSGAHDANRRVGHTANAAAADIAPAALTSSAFAAAPLAASTLATASQPSAPFAAASLSVLSVAWPASCAQANVHGRIPVGMRRTDAKLPSASHSRISLPHLTPSLPAPTLARVPCARPPSPPPPSPPPSPPPPSPPPPLPPPPPPPPSSPPPSPSPPAGKLVSPLATRVAPSIESSRASCVKVATLSKGTAPAACPSTATSLMTRTSTSSTRGRACSPWPTPVP